MKRILLLSDVNSAHTKKWVLGILSRGYEIALFSLSKPTGSWHDQLEHFTLHTAGVGQQVAKGPDAAKLGYLKQVKEVRRIRQQFQPDIIHAHYATSYGLLGAWAKGKCPFYVSVWGSEVFDFPNRSFVHRGVLKRVFKKADRIFSTSEIMKETALKYTSKPITVVPFGVDLSVFTPSGRTESQVLRFGMIKTMAPIYGIDVLLRAFELLQKDQEVGHAELHLYGGGAYLESYREQAASLNLDEAVSFHGQIPHKEVPERLREMDIFVNPSRHESFGVSVLEASATGLPVIVSKVGGLTEVVSADTGILVPVEDHNALYAAMKKLAVNAELRQQMGRGGRELVEQRYDWEACLDQMCSHY